MKRLVMSMMIVLSQPLLFAGEGPAESKKAVSEKSSCALSADDIMAIWCPETSIHEPRRKRDVPDNKGIREEKSIPFHIIRTWFTAAGCGDADTLKSLLLDNNQLIGVCDVSLDATALHCVTRSRAVRQDVLRMAVDFLWWAGADIHARDKKGRTPLHWAAGNGYADIVQMLLLWNDDVEINAQNNDQETPLHWAVLNGQMEAVKLLLQARADVTIENRRGQTPLHMATAANNPIFKDKSGIEKQRQIVRMFLQLPGIIVDDAIINEACESVRPLLEEYRQNHPAMITQPILTAQVVAGHAFSMPSSSQFFGGGLSS